MTDETIDQEIAALRARIVELEGAKTRQPSVLDYTSMVAFRYIEKEIQEYERKLDHIGKSSQELEIQINRLETQKIALEKERQQNVSCLAQLRHSRTKIKLDYEIVQGIAGDEIKTFCRNFFIQSRFSTILRLEFLPDKRIFRICRYPGAPATKIPFPDFVKIILARKRMLEYTTININNTIEPDYSDTEFALFLFNTTSSNITLVE